MVPLLTWLIQGAVGPALVGLPVTWAASDLVGAARRWFRRQKHSDGLSRIVRAATGGVADLSAAEFAAVRRLLEQESTWKVAGSGTVEDLAIRIASCLTSRGGEGSLVAGRAIAAGLLEFALCDLEPEWFQQVLFSRLDRLQTDQARALDEAMAAIHADLAALAAYQHAAAAHRFTRLMGELGLVLDRLPGPADQRQVAVYLAVLARWLDTDPWMRDGRIGGVGLAPASVERKLAIDSDNGDDRTQDADELAGRCSRLAILGGTGSGKTWLARRTARQCAEAALEALAAGKTPDEVELPLYVTCARLAAAPPGEAIRRALVSTALGQLPDLGGARITDAVRVLFEERDAPTLLVADSLDEARGADERIVLADSLSPKWRIVLTSRPASWHDQLDVRGDNPARMAGRLLPLRYPEDVEPVITGWLQGRPGRAAELLAQLRNRPALRQAATVPLILAFYCIAGSDQPLPARRAELYDKVIRRMLAGRWRGGGDLDLDLDACLDALREWAWAAAEADPISGVGAWADEFPAARARNLSRDERDALGHVAVPISPADEYGMTRRRFVHRSIQEHLVAEHVALRMPAEQTLQELMNHLWYDPDWEDAAPAAVAMHPQRDLILKEMIGRLTGRNHLPQDLAALDGCWEIRRFLARVAQESAEGDWSPEAAEWIGQARNDLVTSQRDNLDLVVANDWPSSNRVIVGLLLKQLAAETDSHAFGKLAETVSQLAGTVEDRTSATETLLSRLPHLTDCWNARTVTAAVSRLAVTAKDRAAAREALCALLAPETDPVTAQELAAAFIQLAVSPNDRAAARKKLVALLTRETNDLTTWVLIDAVVEMDPSPDERTTAMRALLGLLADETYLVFIPEFVETVARIAARTEERAVATEALITHLSQLTYETHNQTETEWELADTVTLLAVTAQDRAEVRRALLARLTTETDSETVWQLAQAVNRLAVTPKDRAAARQALLARLSDEAQPRTAAVLAEAVARLDPAPEERAVATQALLIWLTRETGTGTAGLLSDAEKRAVAWHTLLDLLAGEAYVRTGRALAYAAAEVDPEPENWSEAKEALLSLLTQTTDLNTARLLANEIARLDRTRKGATATREALLTVLSCTLESRGTIRILTDAVARLALTPEDEAATTEALLDLLTSTTRPERAQVLSAVVPQRAVTIQDQAASRKALVARLVQLARFRHIDESVPWTAMALVEAVTPLAPALEERMAASQALLDLLPQWADSGPSETAAGLAEAVIRLAVTPGERAVAKQALLRLITLLTKQGPSVTARALAEAVTRLAEAPEDKAPTTEALLDLLTQTTSPWTAAILTEAVARLDPVSEHRAAAGEALLDLITHMTNPEAAKVLAEVAARLDPVSEHRAATGEALLDLITRTADSWMARDPMLLAAARHNVRLNAWVAALPLLSTSTRAATGTDEAPTMQ